ncbi:DUF2987 domain-containing protein [Pseudoalteromonas tunicata]|uniref:DUF2987 domain-containing protein n=1 Tax=Pseudoalteromonas tunicata D2 TaxID=87626 RepID=A4CAS7_9GAMM|nr:DUF2987 domain-containing protein [Pseudoalteromonas tunicata]ATC95032.1 hypothetical protein PTUN_a2571 [Pseudoalteromonas tunicata]EAR28485.1 hypothetical protein PTD2_21757 [Pseudoalteromonas tunicata D2]
MNKRCVGLVSAALLFGSTLNAAEFAVSYDGFYDRMKVVNKGDYLLASVGFYLVDGQTPSLPCDILSGRIVTEQYEQPLSFTDKGQLLLPFEKQLDQDKAVIVVQHSSAQCQLQMQIEARDDYSQSVTKQQLFATYQELDKLMDDLSGFLMSKVFSFLMPHMTGITVEFTDLAEAVNDKEQWQCVKNRCFSKVDQSWETQKDAVLFSQAPVRILPYLEK